MLVLLDEFVFLRRLNPSIVDRSVAEMLNIDVE